MSDPALIEKARTLDRQGDLDGAVRILVEAAETEEAAKLLAGRMRWGDAGRVLLRSLEDVDSPRGKQQSLLAAVYFQKSGEHAIAADLFLAAGDRAKAADSLERAGDAETAAKLKNGGAPIAHAARARVLEAQGRLEPAQDAYAWLKRDADAGRVAAALGRWSQAGAFFRVAHMWYEAGAALYRAGDAAGSLAALAKVPRTHPAYRAAAVAAAKLAATTGGKLNYELESFLWSFLDSKPADVAELDAFYQLATVYESSGVPMTAADLLRKITERDPAYRDAAQRLQRLTTTGDRDALARIVAEEDAFHGRSSKRRRGASEPIAAGPPAAAAPKRKGFPLKTDDGARTLARGISDITNVAPSAAPPRVAAPEGFRVGTVVASRYRLEEPIGAGGMAVVFRATDLELGDPVALKVFAEAADADMVSRIKRELRISRQLSHPNIVRIYDMGIDRGHRYISMELLVGEDLWEHSKKNALSLGQKLDYLMQACAGLQEAHDKGVIHRDVKPENLFVDHARSLKVMDFGLAKDDDKTAAVSRTGLIAGTPEYMSPEQIDDFSAVTPATDLYSLGIVAYKLFTGVVPFSHPNLIPLLMMHANEPPPPPRDKNPYLTPELDALVLQLLEKDPKKRPASARALGERIGEIKKRFTTNATAT